MHWNELSIASYWCFVQFIIISSIIIFYMIIIFYLIIIFFIIILFTLFIQFIFIFIILFNYVIFILVFICILGESNRVPYDLPEAESELVAGFITEYSSLIFSLIIFTEYASIITVTFISIIVFSLHFDCLLIMLYLFCLMIFWLHLIRSEI